MQDSCKDLQDGFCQLQHFHIIRSDLLVIVATGSPSRSIGCCSVIKTTLWYKHWKYVGNQQSFSTKTLLLSHRYRKQQITISAIQKFCGSLDLGQLVASLNKSKTALNFAYFNEN